MIIFLDETTFNHTDKPFKAWSNIKSNDFYKPKGNYKRLNLILACTKDEILSYKLYEFNTNTSVLITFLEDTLEIVRNNERYNEKLNEKQITFYLDNAAYHRSKQLKFFLFKNKLKIIYGAPYACEFNLCEYIFSHIKSEYKKKILLKK